MAGIFNNQNINDINQFEKELSELKSITENYQHLLETLKASESKYRFLTENSADIVWHMDKDFRFTYVSPTDEKIRGFKQDEVVGQKIWDILTPEGSLKLSDTIAERKQKQIQVNQPSRYELQMKCKGGSLIWVEVNVNPIIDVNGDVSGYNGVTRDITERKQFEEEIQKKNYELKELNDTKDKFFSIIAHDLRSPFQGLLGVSNYLVEEAGNLSKEEVKEYAQMLNESLNNQFRFLEDLLSWARIQYGKMKYQPAIVNVFEEVVNVKQMFVTSSTNKNIDLVVNVAREHHVFADRDMLWLLLRNLISNAIKFTNEGGTVELNSSANDEDIIVEVKDNGVGIEKEYLKKLFQMDSHHSTAGTNNESGTGLGLILCKEIIDRHNCTIWVESEVDRGSSFKFTLPKVDNPQYNIFED